ncbi:hypothetical protein TELCIR_20556, partial [Teladorsagia circumcincta]
MVMAKQLTKGNSAQLYWRPACQAPGAIFVGQDIGLAKAVNGWLFCSHEVTRKGFDFSVFDLDYLLQLILADDKNIWLDFVDTSKLTQEEQQEER